MKTILSAIVLSLAAVTLASAATVNTKCPVSGRPAKPSVTSKHDGKTVALCCNNCKKKFDADPEKYAKNLD